MKGALKMMSKRFLILMAVVGMAILFAATGLYAGTDVKDTFTIKTDKYEQRRKTPVEFAHKKHIEEYGYSCGECHHDADGQPRTDLEMGDEVQECIVCHDKMKGARDDIKVHKNAMHGNCQECHKSYNEEEAGDARRGPAPTRCSDCHPRE